jgi:signal peptidase I
MGELQVEAEDTAPPDVVPPALLGPTRSRISLFRLAREVLFMLAVGVAVLFGTRTVAQGREVLGPSMQPTYHQGQRVFISKYLFGGPGRGDVIVFKPPVPSTEEYIKRVVGLPGDHVQVRDGQVWVNGQSLDEPYVHGGTTTCFSTWCDITLGANQYYVMGDNRSNSSDSRFFGPVAGDHISGKVWLRYFPFADFETSF